ncbi:hypothetical protein B0J13DRAFT_137149 [Dactylonectria estremocensis]|uniref:Uncharacterized protein n=1 Tax=Dactylonectria estremocensis TaxID=1079267 RepID=A0A9P9IR31_9HYPO|nr:hypothetical protein B0J13DRAFT_137149 [Dactylonectria estremocensis]
MPTTTPHYTPFPRHVFRMAAQCPKLCAGAFPYLINFNDGTRLVLVPSSRYFLELHVLTQVLVSLLVVLIQNLVVVVFCKPKAARGDDLSLACITNSRSEVSLLEIEKKLKVRESLPWIRTPINGGEFSSWIVLPSLRCGAHRKLLHHRWRLGQQPQEKCTQKPYPNISTPES